ncbi:MAG: ornithine cyclodeaminase family protein [Bacteroidota bacterium]
MTKIFTKKEIKEATKHIDLLSEIEKGLVTFSAGNVNVPPIGEMLFEEPPGEVHIKYGYIANDDYYVIKIASGFYKNPALGLPSANGTMLVFSQKTGELLSVLLDEGYLTSLRTAATGAIVAKYLAPKKITKIGIIGTGIQAQLQLEYLEKVTDCKEVLVWGRNKKHVKAYVENMRKVGFQVEIAPNTAEIGRNCNLIVTCTPSAEPLILDKHIGRGTHITAIGSDTSEKNELEALTLAKADIVVTDSLEQCRSRGEIFQAWINGLISDDNVQELGNVITDKSFQRNADSQLTIADLTGVAVQDIQTAKAVYQYLISK